MSGFVSRPPTPAPPAATTAGVIAGGWWPDVDLDALRAAMRVDPAVTNPRLRDEALLAIIDVQDELSLWAAAHLAAGHVALASVPAATVDDESRLVLLYVGAVRNATAARLLGQFADIGATRSGEVREDERRVTEPSHAVLMRQAIRALLARPRMTVDLI